MRVSFVVLFLVVVCLCGISVVAQSPSGSITGIVLDPGGKTIPGAEIIVVNDLTRMQYVSSTNGDGIYTVANLPPGPYRIQVSKIGFKAIIKPDIILNVQDALSLNFTLSIGAPSVVVTVEGGAPMVNTTDAAVSTVVDRQFAENIPLNGRSFQTLIQLTPGVALTASNASDGGQFSVDGQRASSNYWTVDGVSANIGSSANFAAGNGLGGALPSFSALGGTNSLVSVDAMQEFRIQTSSYAPEFGRTPGGQVSIVTRSGTNRFHGTVFDYFRNSVLDANNWFADSAGLPKPQERQNDFGGTFSGPVLKDRTFFFFSYEGLRLRLPQTTLTSVPDTTARQNAIPAVQPFLNAFPLPNGPDNAATGVAQFNSSFSNKGTLDAYSLRIDHKAKNRVNVFGRYNYSPSELVERGASTLYPLSDVEPINVTTQTATLGVTWALTPFAANDFRFNYSRTDSSSSFHLDGFGGAVPLTTLPFPGSFSPTNAFFDFVVFSLEHPHLSIGSAIQNVQRQINFVDTVLLQKRSHSLKVGADYRRLSPSHNPFEYEEVPFFRSVPAAENGALLFSLVSSLRDTTFVLHNLGLFAQDTWRIHPRFTLTYGLRWDVDFSPSTARGPNLPAVTGFDLNNPSNLALAPAGTPPFKTRYTNLAPRLGIAYQLSQSQNWVRVIRGGVGMFYDLATSEAGNLLGQSYPFGASKRNFGGTFPLDAPTAAPPPITAAQLSSVGGTLGALDPHLNLPYALEWNVAVEQELSRQQTISASYIGSLGRRLLQSAFVFAPNPSFNQAVLVGNAATSDYEALQVQFQRRLLHALQGLASYTWSHSIDTGSAGSFATASNTFVPTVPSNANRGSSDFDIRNSLSVGLTYAFPAPKTGGFAQTMLRGWSLQSVLQARSAAPVNVYYSFLGQFEQLFNAVTLVRPDVVSGLPRYLYGPQFPGGKALNNTSGAVPRACPDGSQSIGPFCPPPVDANGNPVRQGNLGRNALRGFGATQWDLAIHRDFPLHEALKLQFRAEMFNVINHPSFGAPIGDLTDPRFGLSTQVLANSLGGDNLGGGGFSSLYEIGGPRSIQLALKLSF